MVRLEYRTRREAKDMTMIRGQAWETAFITLWISSTDLPTERARALVECAKRADDVVAALEEARELPPVSRSEQQVTIPPEAIDSIPLSLLPSLRSYFRLWRALAIEPGNVDYYRDQLVRALDGIPAPYQSSDLKAATARLVYIDMTHQNLEDLEVMIFGRSLPKEGIVPDQPPTDAGNPDESLP